MRNCCNISPFMVIAHRVFAFIGRSRPRHDRSLSCHSALLSYQALHNTTRLTLTRLKTHLSQFIGLVAHRTPSTPAISLARAAFLFGPLPQ